MTEANASLRIRLAGIEEDSIVDGPGLRLTLFTQGCRKNCPGCHNPQTHSLSGGQEHVLGELLEIYAANPLLTGITFSGGEPFLQPWPLAVLALEIHALGGNVITFSGHTYEELLARNCKAVNALLEASDILVDGPYQQDLRNEELKFRGSENQRYLDRSERQRLLTAFILAHSHEMD